MPPISNPFLETVGALWSWRTSPFASPGSIAQGSLAVSKFGIDDGKFGGLAGGEGRRAWGCSVGKEGRGGIAGFGFRAADLEGESGRLAWRLDSGGGEDFEEDVLSGLDGLTFLH